MTIDERYEIRGLTSDDADELVEAFTDDAQGAYDGREQALGEDTMRELERQVLLTVLDRKWREHLYEMDYLREGIGLRAMAQRDPLVEYQREGGEMFTSMMEAFKEEVVGYLFNLEIQSPAQQVGLVTDESGEPVTGASMSAGVPLGKGLEHHEETELSYSSPDESGEVSKSEAKPKDKPFANVGRNQKCPCGSGKKFKNCHGAPGRVN